MNFLKEMLIQMFKRVLFIGLGGAGQRHLRLFKENLADVMLEKYQKLYSAGYNIDNNEIKNDMNLLLNKNPNKFL